MGKTGALKKEQNMGQYVYGKNVVRQLLTDNKKIYEIILVEGFKDKELEGFARKKVKTIKTLPKKKLDQFLKTEYHQGIAAFIDDYKTKYVIVY